MADIGATIYNVAAGGILSMREALREVYGTEISTIARIGALLRHVATVAAALLSRRG